MPSLTPEQRELVVAAAQELSIRAARRDSSVFVDGFFGYTSAPFQREWHRQWNQPDARVVQWVSIEHGKTQQATGWALHRLGTDPVRARILWIGASSEAAEKSTSIIKTAIEKPPPYLRAVFPALRPGSKKWTQAAFSVSEAKVTEKDYSVQRAGVGKQILGGRYTDIVLDDVLNFDTTYTAEQRGKLVKWFFSTIPGRLLEGGRIICLGNAWYPDDLMHEMAKRGYTVIRQEAYRETGDGQIIPESVLWPAQWSVERLEKRREELGPIEAQRQLRCIPYQPGEGRFQMEWFDQAMEAGRDLTFVDEYQGPEPVFMGVDVGISEKEGRDPWGLWAFRVNPKTQRRTLLNAAEERMDGRRGIDTLKDWYRRYGAVLMVENNAAQDFIRQFAGAEGVPTLPFTTGKNKADPAFGVPSLGVELSQGMWILPCADERSQRMAVLWRTQCLAFAPGQHTGDLLMASWFAREAARKGQIAAAVNQAPATSPAGYGNTKAQYGAGRGRLFRR